MTETGTPRPFLGLLQRKQRLVLTWRGWLLLIAVLASAALLFIRNVYGFLAVNDPRTGGILVIEGWSPDYVIEHAVELFRRGQHEKICITGGPVEEGNPLREYRTYAECGRAICLKLGVPAESVHAIPAVGVERDRSYASALALRRWLGEQGIRDAKINIAGNGTHSRRTRLVYEKALGPGVSIGISNAGERNFDPKRWWVSSAGVRSVVDELVAYAYARFFFHPSPPQP